MGRWEVETGDSSRANPVGSSISRDDLTQGGKTLSHARTDTQRLNLMFTWEVTRESVLLHMKMCIQRQIDRHIPNYLLLETPRREGTEIKADAGTWLHEKK